MNNYFVSGIVVASALLGATFVYGQTPARDELAKVYRESADLPEFTKSLRRSEALSKYNPIDATAAAQPSKWDVEATAAREQMPGMYPEDVERLRNQTKQKGRN